MIIVFLIDTSASMNQRVFHGGHPRFIDIAKGAVESFVKARQKQLESRQIDRYMLFTFDDPPDNMKAGWKENLNTFTTELKNLQCFSMTGIGVAVKRVFEILNVNRMQTGIDNYGQGRNPYYLDPTMIILITDGGRLTANSMSEIAYLQQSTSPNLELTREAYRWDQRLFAIVLRFTGTPIIERDNMMVPNDNSVLENMCEMTGGRSYCITSQRTLMQCIDSLLSKAIHGVVVNFEKCGPDPSPAGNRDGDHNLDSEHGSKIANGNLGDGLVPFRNNFTSKHPNIAQWQSCRKLIYVKRDIQKNTSFWPIPEPFWPEPSTTTWPQRMAHPLIKFSCIGHDPSIIDNLPFDKYELEPSPLTQYILGRRQPGVCWQCFVPNSSRNAEVMYPFGYLKSGTNLACVNLYVMPFNYPMFFPILEEVMKNRMMQKIPSEIKQQFQNYMRTVPVYYITPLRKALEKMGVSKPVYTSLLGEQGDSFYNFNVSNYMKKMKAQGKAEFDKLCNEVSSRVGGIGTSLRRETVRMLPYLKISKELISHPALRGKFVNVDDKLKEHSNHVIAVTHKIQRTTKSGPQAFRNPFEIPRKNLVDHISKMRLNFLQKNLTYSNLLDYDMSHSMLITQMGNYQEYLKRKSLLPLRELETTQIRQHTFGNPFKIEKKMVVDEADVDMQRNSSRRSSEQSSPSYKIPSRKRKPGPLPRNYVHKRIHLDSLSSISTPPASPCSTVSSSSDLSPPSSPMSNASEIIISCDSDDDEDDHSDNEETDNDNRNGDSNENDHMDCSNGDIIDINNDDDNVNDSKNDNNDMPLLTAAGEDENGDGSRLFRSPSPPSLEILSAIGVDSFNYNEDILPPSLSPISDIDDNIVTNRLNGRTVNNNDNNTAAIEQFSMEKFNGNVRTNDIEQYNDVSDNLALENGQNNDGHCIYKYNSINNDNHDNNSTGSNSNDEAEDRTKYKKFANVNMDQMENCVKCNFSVKSRMFNAVRSYGADCNVLFEHLKLLQGTVDMKMCIIEDTIRESYKFKRYLLASKLKNLLHDQPINEYQDDDYDEDEEGLKILNSLELDLHFGS